MEKRAVIGISTGLITDDGGIFPGYRRIYVNEDYINAILSAGGVPVMIPMNGDRAALSAVVDKLDALLITGGDDIDPIYYGEEPHRGLGKIVPERDSYDFTLYELARERHLPILGVCRGFQLINVAEGGSLYQDLGERSGEVLKHSQGHSPRVATHSVAVKAGSRLAEILGVTSHRVNSFHHQTVKKVGEPLTEVATAADGVTEAIELPGDDFLIAVQWHPEMLERVDPVMRKLWSAFIAAGQQYRAAKN